MLAGGESSRMGRDKALLPWQGQTLVGHIAASVLEAAGTVTLIGSPERYGALGLPVVADLTPDCGPLGGLLTALTVSPAEWSLVVACDMPSLSAVFLETLCRAAEQLDGGCLIPCPPSGRLEPLCAVYHRGCLPVVRQLVQEKRLKMTEALTSLQVVSQPVAEAAWFENLNTHEDWLKHRADNRLTRSVTDQVHV